MARSLGIILDNFLIFPAVLVGHYQSEIFGVLLVIAEFLLSLPFLEVAFTTLKP